MSSSFQNGLRQGIFGVVLRLLLVVLGILYYVAVIRFTVLKLAMMFPYSNDWPEKKVFTGPDPWDYEYVKIGPTFFDLSMVETDDWVVGVFFGTLLSIVLAAAAYGLYSLLRWAVLGPAAKPVCRISNCACQHHIAADERNRRWRQYAWAAALGAAIGAISSQ